MSPATDQNTPMPWPQRLMENIWFLLLLGTVVPTLIYTVWSLVDLVQLPHFMP